MPLRLSAIISFLVFLAAFVPTISIADPQSKQQEVIGWGANLGGQLGIGTRGRVIESPTPSSAINEILKPGYTVRSIALGDYTACLLRSDNTVWCWGGDVASNFSIPAVPPAKVEGLPANMTEITGHLGEIFCAKSKSSNLQCWRWGSPPSKPARPSLGMSEKVATENKTLIKSFVDVYISYKSICAINKRGEIWCWAGSIMGGDPDTAGNYPTNPINVSLPGPALRVKETLGADCATLRDKSLWCWKPGKHPTAALVTKFAPDVKEIRTVGERVFFVKNDGSVWAWARRVVPFWDTPVPVYHTEGTQKFSSGDGQLCGLKSDRTGWCWNSSDGEMRFSFPPAQKASEGVYPIKTLSQPEGLKNIVQITTAYVSALAVVEKEANSTASNDAERSALLYQAVAAYKFEEANKTLKTITQLDITMPTAKQALILASEQGEAEIVKALVTAFKASGIKDGHATEALLAATCHCKLGLKPTASSLRALFDAGADITVVSENGPVVSEVFSRDEKISALFLEEYRKKTGRHLMLKPPSDIQLHNIPVTDKSCPSGKVIFEKAGDYEIDVPETCGKIFVKAWGAGGGSSSGSRFIILNGKREPPTGLAGGGSGGFSVGIVTLPAKMKAKLKVLVGGAGGASSGPEAGKGGYNGGGDGGGGRRQAYTPRDAGDPLAGLEDAVASGGGGGGGASEILLFGKQVVIAGGGGGAAERLGGAPGGGLDPQGYKRDYLSLMPASYPEKMEKEGALGGDGIGGKSGILKQRVQTFVPPQDGTAKAGGNGAYVQDGLSPGGGGGGGGHGGGGGGSIGGCGGGGGGFVPTTGISLWSGINFEIPNSADPDYKKDSGTPDHDGLVVVSWPAPDEDAFAKAVLPYFSAPMEKEETVSPANAKPEQDGTAFE